MRDLTDAHPGEFVALTWYVFSPAWTVPGGEARFSGYGFSGTPSAKFDGVVSHVGGQASGTLFPVYEPIVAQRLTVASPLTIDTHWAAIGDELTVSATITLTENLAAGSRQVIIAIAEDGAHNQVNLVRLLHAPEPFALTEAGTSVTVARTCAVDPDWNLEAINPVVLVEHAAGGVLQAAQATPDFAGTISVDASPDLLGAPWRLQGPEGFDLRASGDATLPVFATGTYTLTWASVPGWSPPSPQQVSGDLVDGGLVLLCGAYTDGPFAVAAVAPLADDGPAAGISLVDLEGDGDLDVFLARPGAANRLLRQDDGFVFTDVAAGDLAAAAATMTGVWTDQDGDGDQDVVLVRDGAASLLLRQTGPGQFAAVSTAGLDGAGPGRAASWIDYDRDGFLDLHVVQHGQADRLLRCLFSSPAVVIFASQTGVIANPGHGTAAPWCDWDADGWDDLFVVNAYDANALLRNHAGQAFIDETSGLLGEVSGGTAAAWGDVDGDGLFDLFVANDPGLDRLFLNAGGDFSLQPDPAVDQAGPTRTPLWFDHDLDGDLDLYLCRDGAPDRLLRQDDGTFTVVPIGWPESLGPSAAAACGDIDGDGDIDVVIARDGAPDVVLRNETPAGRWLQLTLHASAAGNRDAIGARVRVVAGGRSQVREVRAGGGSLAQDARTLHFGLGAATRADSVIVTWPDRSVEVRTRLAANSRWDVVQGEVVAAPEIGAPAPTALAVPVPNPANPSTTLSFTLEAAGWARLEIFDASGRRIRTLVAGELTAGVHAFLWHGDDHAGRSVASGTYLARLTTAAQSHSQKVTVIE